MDFLYIIGYILSLCYLFVILFVLLMFFRIAKDVRAIKYQGGGLNSKSSGKEEYKKFLFLVHNGYKEEAKRLALNMIWNTDEMNIILSTKSIETFDLQYNKLKEGFANYFELLGEDFPSYNSLRDKIAD